ncbi:MAG: type II toxin-antitoxin system Phd/YefM family antitoxin [Betaproteobacteria bacterium]
MEVSIREMKNRLSKYLKLVRAGKDVVITDRGRPVARLTVVQLSAKEAEAEYIKRIRALPWVRPGKRGRIRGLRQGIALRGKGPAAAEIVLRDRE